MGNRIQILLSPEDTDINNVKRIKPLIPRPGRKSNRLIKLTHKQNNIVFKAISITFE